MLYFSDEDYNQAGEIKNGQIVQQGEETVESRLRRKDGEPIYVLVSFMPLDVNDLSKGVSTTVLDITERKKAEEALQQLNEELEEWMMRRTAQLQQRNIDLESFSYSISHDLRASLRAISGFSQKLLDEHLPEWDAEAWELFERMMAASKWMDLLIEGLLLLAEVGQQQLQLVPIDLSQVTEQTYQSLVVNLPVCRIIASFQPGKIV
jgi:signal transduction histidine kinase